MYFLFFKQKTAYEMRISDWSSDVCSSDLNRRSAYGNYSYTIKTGYTSKLAFGLGVGFVQLALDGDKLEPYDQGDQYITQGMQSTIVFDSRAGLFLSDEHFYAGFSVDNMLATHIIGNKDKQLITQTHRPNHEN